MYMNKILSIKRNSFIDFTKGVAIILVVVGHCIQYGSGQDYLKGELSFDNNLFKLIKYYSDHRQKYDGYIYNI